MFFNSFEFLIFFPIVVLCYFLIPHKFRYIWILVSSFFFYMCWNPIYGLLLAGVIVLTYFGARLIGRYTSTDGKSASIKKAKVALALTVAACILVLCLFKYLQYFANTVCALLGLVGAKVSVPIFSIVVPVGISFYLFQSLGYVIDVYRGKIKAERNLIMYAAYISFFPQLVAGPIERADKLLPQFYEEHIFEYERVRKNLLLMLWGFFLKLVIADRLAIFVDNVYDNYEIYGGWLLIVATIFFAFQIYCDFAGYSIIAKGAAGVMGFELMDNFDAPYCAGSVRNFWARWHISLTSWFKDYIYIPLGGNRRGAFRKYLNTLTVFLLSGLWHGASWSFVFWGGLNGAYIVAEELWGKLCNKLAEIFKVKFPAIVHKIFGTVITFAAVDFAWIFFRAPGLREAVLIIKRMFTFDNAHVFSDGTVSAYIMDPADLTVGLVSIAVLLTVDICHCRKVHFRELLFKQNIVVRWLFYWLFIMTILIFGIWGSGFDETMFIYFQF